MLGCFTWTEAKTAAATREHLGEIGYLATITSQGEQTFIEQLFDGVSFPPCPDLYQEIWIGASSVGQPFAWSCVAGPEAGQEFWHGLFDGAPVGGAYSNWGTPGGVQVQPDGDNPYGVNAVSIEFGAGYDGQWNDSQPDRVGVGYLVEFGGAAAVFSTFTPRTEFTLGPKANDDSYWVRGWLKLAKTSNGIDPLTEAVTIKIGPFSHTLPVGSL